MALEHERKKRGSGRIRNVQECMDGLTESKPATEIGRNDGEAAILLGGDS